MHALQVDNLTKTYASGVESLKGITLNVEEGDYVTAGQVLAQMETEQLELRLTEADALSSMLQVGVRGNQSR